MNGNKKEGALTMTCEGADGYRLDIRYPDGSYHGGLHCGDNLEVLCERVWTSTTVESGFNDDGEDDWYLTGLYKPGGIPNGLTARR